MNELAHSLLVAFSLMLVIEGILPFLYPQRWRRLVVQMAQISNANMRVLGLLSMLLGLALLWLVR
ncbi:MAG: DUF2065 domain-containing protein [Gammaproteobacteria bacterium]|jgi:hypothetical protein|nr:DUF2065 domain-containing protein [Gammaproteobacteria bacterium]MCP4879727.1 DUF2065 domain-containing protein [Gammaproteobacteria bacterium]MDP6164965.1 DUF2065 domain-containing protein [Gammaproteobacteria bacterium]